MGKRILIIGLFLITGIAKAQNYKFGKVSIDELEEKECSVDSSANAAILYSEEKINYKYSVDDGFAVRKEVYKRIKIYSQEGLGVANIEERLYDKNNSSEEKIEGLKACTFNIEKGKLVKTKLVKSTVINEKLNEYWKVVKIALPNVKVGSVVEYKYTIVSPFPSMLDDVYLQEEIPIVNSLFEARIPDYFTFKIHKNFKSSFNPVIETESSNRKETVTWRGKTGQGGIMSKYERELDFKEKVYTFNGSNIPAIKKEPFVGNINDYKSKLSFELVSTKNFNNLSTSYATDWGVITKKIYESESFGGQLDKKNYFKDDVDELIKTTLSNEEKIEKLFNYVKTKVKWNDFIGVYTSEGVKNAYKKNSGNVAEINLMLTAMLRYAGISANPVLVSTKSNGVPLFPTRQGFNYVVCGVEVQEKVVLLDATQPYASVNNLPNRALNWQGRIIRERGSSAWVDLYPKSNSKNVSMVAAELNSDMEIKGKSRSQKTDYLAFNYRKENADVSAESLTKKIKKSREIEVLNFEVSNIKELSKPIIEVYDFVYEEGVEEIGSEIYIEPLLFFTEKENIFNQEKRNYPIDFKYPVTDKTIINLKIPEGYKIKSYPKSEKVVMAENLGGYSYLVRANGNHIQVSQEFKINFPIIPASYYVGLRDTYKKMIEKNAEKIVLEKI